MSLTSVPFAEVREILRTCVHLGTTGMPIWGSEAIILGSVTPEDLLVTSTEMTTISYERVMNIFREADMAGLPGPAHHCALLNQQTREIVLPPIVEYFGEDAVLIFGYEALYKAAAERTQGHKVPAIIVKRTVMKQAPLPVLEKPWPSTPHKYAEIKKWEKRSGGERRLFVFDH